MQIQINQTQSTSTSLSIVANSDDMQATKVKIEKQLTKDVKLPGFRAGKAPAHLALKEVDKNVVSQHFLQEFVPKISQQALEEKQVKPVIPPQVTVTKFVPYETLEVTVETHHIGKVDLVDYKTFKEVVPSIKIDSTDVDKVIDNIRHNFADYKEVSRSAQVGDQLTIDFAGFNKQGEAIDNTSATDYKLIIGQNSLIEGFEDKLVGSKAGEKLELDLIFPKDYRAKSLASKPVLFKVTIKKTEAVNLPEIDDQLALKVSSDQLKTVAELKKSIKEELLEERQRQVFDKLQAELVAKITEKSTIELPQALIEAEITMLKEQLNSDLDRSQVSFERFLKDMELTEAEHHQKLTTIATNRLKGGVVLREIAQLENITVNDEEVEKLTQLNQIKQQSSSNSDHLKQDIRAQLMTEKTLNRLAELVFSREKAE